MRPIIVKRVIYTTKIAAGRSVAGKFVMRTVNQVVDSDLITDVAEDFVDHHSTEARSKEWPDLKEPPEKLSEISFVANEILHTISNVLDSPEAIFMKIKAAQSGGVMNDGLRAGT